MRKLIPSLVAGAAMVTASFGVGGHALAAQHLPTAAAGSPRGSVSAPAAHRLISQLALASHSIYNRSQKFSPLAVLAGPARMSYSDLALPQAVWSGMTNYQDGAVDATHPGPFKAAHSKNYANIQGGYVQAGQLGQATYFYQGSYFSDVPSAQAAFQDAITTTGTWQGQSKDCSADYQGLPCYIDVFPSGTSDTAIYEEVQVNYCVVEAQAQASSTYMNANVDAITTQFAKIIATGAVLATQVCTGTTPASSGGTSGGTTGNPAPTPTAAPTATAAPSITIDQVGLVHEVNGQAKATTSLKGGEGGIFVAIYHDANAGTDTPTGSVTFTIGGTTLGTLQLQEQTAQDGTTGMIGGAKFKAKKKAQHITATFTLSVDGATATQSMNFTVKKKKKK